MKRGNRVGKVDARVARLQAEMEASAKGDIDTTRIEKIERDVEGRK